MPKDSGVKVCVVCKVAKDKFADFHCRKQRGRLLVQSWCKRCIEEKLNAQFGTGGGSGVSGTEKKV